MDGSWFGRCWVPAWRWPRIKVRGAIRIDRIAHDRKRHGPMHPNREPSAHGAPTQHAAVPTKRRISENVQRTASSAVVAGTAAFVGRRSVFPGLQVSDLDHGRILPTVFLATPYFYDGYATLGLAPPPAGYQWVRYGPDLLLVNVRSGAYRRRGRRRVLLSLR